MTSPETTHTVERHDHWSLWIPALGLVAVILLWWSIVANASMPLILLTLLTDLVIAGVVVIMLLIYLVVRRVRAALSALIAVAIIVCGFAARISVLNAARYLDFAIHRAGYERTVEVLRAKNSRSVPLRVVLEDADRSVWVVPAIFDYIVYDESDAIGGDPPVHSGIWLSAIPGNDTTTIDGGNIVVRRLSGHFYFVEETS